ncbi:unnamed protein product, partial [Brassica rapa subsp. trilocularis]
AASLIRHRRARCVEHILFASASESIEKPSSSLVVTPKFHMKFPPEGMPIYHLDDRQFAYGYASGLIYFYGMWTKMKAEDGVPVIRNPKTGRYEILPYIYRYRTT